MGGTWRKSSYSGANGGDCAEVAADTGLVLVRDTKNRVGATSHSTRRPGARSPPKSRFTTRASGSLRLPLALAVEALPPP